MSRIAYPRDSMNPVVLEALPCCQQCIFERVGTVTGSASQVWSLAPGGLISWKLNNERKWREGVAK